MNTLTQEPCLEASTYGVDPEALMAVASHVQREYGHAGYKVAVAFTATRAAAFEISHFDGSRFNLIADKWGNVRRPEADTASAAMELLLEMHRAAFEA